MSYLNSLRLHFSGKFQAAPSTVNNDPVHFDSATFVPSYQDRQIDPKGPPKGWWNPMGDAAWRLIACKVRGAWIEGAQATPEDAIHTCIIADSDRTVSAKLVDLDPEQQSVSEVWGMQVRICKPDGTTLLRSHFKTAPFTEIWDRAPGGGDLIASAIYQSVLTNLEWGDVECSPFLKKLRASAADGLLSIKFNVDGYDIDFSSPDFTRGRIVGTIGPASPAEPKHFVLGRHFMAVDAGGGAFFVPKGGMNFCQAVVDAGRGKIIADLGNSLPTVTSGGQPENVGALTLTYPVTVNNKPASATIGEVPYLDADWYANTAGVVELPADRRLTVGELQSVQDTSLSFLLTDNAGNTQPGISEPPDGLYLRADNFVFRLNPGDTASTRVYATRWGKPYGGARVISFPDTSQLQALSLIGTPPDVAVPAGAINFPCHVVTDANGVGTLSIRAADPGNPRQYIDGQVYGVRPVLEETLPYGTGYPVCPWDFISLLVWSGFKPDSPVTWYGSIKAIMVQYANLYPVMKGFLDLSNYDSVCANAGLLKLAFSLPPEDPNSMPVTRDLSAAKRTAILQWLTEPGEDGMPRKGKETLKPVLVATPAAPASSGIEPSRGGKAAAFSRRLFLLRK